jgi:hypothetical protein
MSNKNKLSADQQKELLKVLKARFEKNMKRHKGIDWNKVQTKLEANPGKLWSLDEMEATGGEPDVVVFDNLPAPKESLVTGKAGKTGEYIFYDCSAESPKGRRSLCYDHEALEKRKEHKPKDSAINMATEMGIEILTEEQYRELQQLGEFDAKTSSWLKTPDNIRKLGGGISGEFRFGTVFVYANGAESYSGARGFRGSLKV